MQQLATQVMVQDAPPSRTAGPAPGEAEHDRFPKVPVERAVVIAGDAAAFLGAALLAGLAPVVAAAATAWVVTLLSVVGEYRRPRVSFSALREVPRLTSRLAVMVAVLALVLSWRGLSDDAVRDVVMATSALLAGRFVSFAVVRGLRRRGVLSAPTLIVGAGSVGAELARYLVERPEFGMSVVGVVDDPEGVRDADLVGGLEDLPEVVARTGATRVIVTFGVARDWQLIEVIRRLPAEDLEVLVVPRLFEVGAGAADSSGDDVGGIPLTWLDRPASRLASRRIKRGFDVVVAVALLALTFPLLAACVVAVRLSGEGPVLFRQQRLGQAGRPFTLYKFRSMRVNGDSETLWTVRDDPRLTRVGRVLRRTNLDELPQLMNILRGDMSLVGPRPERPYFVERFARTFPGYAQRHRSPAGLTGWAQIHGLRGDTSIEDRVRFDNYYIDNWSLWRDLTILLRTVTAFNRRD